MAPSNFDEYAYKTARDIIYIHGGMETAMRVICETNVNTLGDRLAGFLAYCSLFAHFLHDHHHHEEEVIFPDALLRAKTTIEPLVTKFVDFHKILIPSVEKVLAESALEPTVARAKAVQDLVSGFRAGLLEHFKAEEVAMDARFYLKFYNQKTLRAMMRRLDKEIQKADPAKSLPFVVYHLSPEGLVWFYGRIPWFVRVLLLPMLARKNDAAWSFAPNVTRNSSGKLIAPPRPVITATDAKPATPTSA